MAFRSQLNHPSDIIDSQMCFINQPRERKKEKKKQR